MGYCTEVTRIVEMRHQNFVELNRLLEAKEALRLQQSKKKWLNEGDANTRFFHGAVERRRINEIHGVRVNG